MTPIEVSNLILELKDIIERLEESQKNRIRPTFELDYDEILTYSKQEEIL